jgi:uncharacterized membrane protein YjgN (DUF898 family)
MNQLSTNQSTNQKTTPIVFTGKASEYFGIWIVNLLLSIVTLGIYSAWAKVRRKKYFYNNTLIENVGFDYHAKPISILKGRIIAFVLFALYVYGKGSSPVLAGVLVILFFLALPWLIVRGSLFNARNTSHRGLRFDFKGTVSQAIRVYIGLPILTFFTLGLIWPYIAHEKSQFIMNSHRFGLSQFNMSRVVKQFYKVYLIVFIVPFIGILAAIAIPAYQAYVNKAKAAAGQPQAMLSIPFVQAFAPIHAQSNMVLALNEATTEMEAPVSDEMQNAGQAPTAIDRVYSDNIPAEIEPAPIDALPAEIDTELPSELASEEAAPRELTPEEELQMIKEEKAAAEMEEKMATENKIKEWLSSPIGVLAALGGVILYGLFIFGFLAYFQSRIGNLVWNNTKLDQLSFKSSLRARDFTWLYLSNLVVIMLTFGLATPWAQIRMARYRASKLEVLGDVNFDQFVGDKKEEIKATGEEIADMFDVDLSFG